MTEATAIPDEVRARVRAGATLLDVHVVGWETRIDIEELRLSSCAECVLGQLFGDFTDGLIAIGISDGANLGFAMTLDIRKAIDKAADAVEARRIEMDFWRALRRAWLDEIAARLECKAPAAAHPEAAPCLR